MVTGTAQSTIMSVISTPRLRTACDTCHQLKVRCSGTMPCKTCANSDSACFYSLASRVGRPKGSRNKQSLKGSKPASGSLPSTLDGVEFHGTWSPITPAARVNSPSDHMLGPPRKRHAGAQRSHNTIVAGHALELHNDAIKKRGWDVSVLEGADDNMSLDFSDHNRGTHDAESAGGQEAGPLRDPAADHINKDSVLERISDFVTSQVSVPLFLPVVAYSSPPQLYHH